MAKVSRLSLGHNPNKAVDSLRRSLESEVAKAPKSQLNTLGQLHQLMHSLVKIANSLGESSGSSLGLSSGFRRSQSGETFLKSMLDQKMNRSQKNFKQQLEQFKDKLPINLVKLSGSLTDLKENTLDQLYDELWTLDKEAGHLFASNHRKRLSKSFDILIKEFLDLNAEKSTLETKILTSSFLQKISPKRIRTLDEVDAESFLGMKAFFNEFLKYFEEQVKDPLSCKQL